MKKASILLADDHKMIVEGLSNLLEPEFELAGIVDNGRELIDSIHNIHPDVIVADISMPFLNGIDAARQINKDYPNIKIIFLTMHSDVAYAAEAFEAGASGYVLKHSATSELINAIHEVLKGRNYITPMIAKDLLLTYKKGTHNRNDTLSRLSHRQREVLQLLAEGRSAKEIASILNISTRTVEFHKYRMMNVLGIKSSAELIQIAIKHGIVLV